MNELVKFKRECKNCNMCELYTMRWDRASSPEDIIRLAVDAQGCEWLYQSHKKGLSIPIEYIKKRFANYINGKYVAKFDGKRHGYDGELYVGYDGEIEVRTTNLLLIGCNPTLIFPNYSVSNVYLIDSKMAGFKVKDENCDFKPNITWYE